MATTTREHPAKVEHREAEQERKEAAAKYRSALAAAHAELARAAAAADAEQARAVEESQEAVRKATEAHEAAVEAARVKHDEATRAAGATFGMAARDAVDVLNKGMPVDYRWRGSELELCRYPDGKVLASGSPRPDGEWTLTTPGGRMFTSGSEDRIRELLLLSVLGQFGVSVSE